MRQTDLFIGIDLGTTNSSIAYVPNDPRLADARIIQVQTLAVEQDDLLGSRSVRVPTIVSKQFDDRRVKKPLIGWEFFRQLGKPKRKAGLLRHGQGFFRSVKSDLGSYRIYPRAFSPDYNEPEKVAAAILRHLLESAARQLPEYQLRTARVVLTVPASLSEAARASTREAAKLAGIDPSQLELIDEPTAALIDLLNGPKPAAMLDKDEHRYLAIFDYGGGTLDISLIRARFDQSTMSGLRVENTAISAYRRLGGDVIDQQIMDTVIWPEIEKAARTDRKDVPIGDRRMLEDTLTFTVARSLKEGVCRAIQKKLDEGTSWEHIRLDSVHFSYRFEGRTFDVPFLNGPLPRRYALTGKQFAEIMEPYLEGSGRQFHPSEQGSDKSLLQPLMEVLERGGIEPYQLDYLVLHGSSCRNPFVRKFLKDEFESAGALFSGTTITTTPDIDASVACGAALACYWKHGRGHELVKPIIPEEVGIMTLGDKPAPLVKAGETLPFPDKDGTHLVPTEFFVPRTGQKEMLVPFYSGLQQRIVGTVKVKLPPNAQRDDPVRIKLRITSDKTLEWWYSICERGFLRAESISDPWTPTAEGRHARQLVELRLWMRDKLRTTGAISVDDEYREAALLHDTGKLDELELLLADLPVTEDTNTAARIDNLRGLLHSSLDREEEAVEFYSRASQTAPEVAVYRGNLGCALADVGRIEEAIAHMRGALSLDPDLSYLYERLGDLCRKQGAEYAARREYQEAVRVAERVSAGVAEDWSTLARLYHKLGDYEKEQDARQRSYAESRNQVFGGDHTQRIAGPDSGFLPMQEVEE